MSAFGNFSPSLEVDSVMNSFINSYSQSTEWSVWMLGVNKRKNPWKQSSKLCIAHLLLVLIILGCLLWDGHCACSHGGSTFSRLYAIRFLCVGVAKNVYAERHTYWWLNPLNPELNPTCYLLALLGAHHFLHVSRIRVKSLILRLLMSYIYIYMTLVA